MKIDALLEELKVIRGKKGNLDVYVNVPNIDTSILEEPWVRCDYHPVDEEDKLIVLIDS